MKGALLGSKYLVSLGNTDQTVWAAFSEESLSRQSKTTAPYASVSRPRCFWYQARSFSGSFDLKKIPLIPITLFMKRSSFAYTKLNNNLEIIGIAFPR